LVEEAEALVIGPRHDILLRSGDKLQARLLAEEYQFPVLPALRTTTSDIAELAAFVSSVGYLIIIKAVDGGVGVESELLKCRRI
jgi:pyruvate carboxylase